MQKKTLTKRASQRDSPRLSMRTRKPRRGLAGNNAEKLRPDHPNSQDATSTTVHDRKKPSRTETNEKGRPALAVQTFAEAVPAKCSWRRAQRGPDTARRKSRPRQEDSCPAHDESNCLAHASMDEKHNTKNFCTRLFAPSRLFIRSIRGRGLRRSGGAVHHVQHVDKQGMTRRKTKRANPTASKRAKLSKRANPENKRATPKACKRGNLAKCPS